MDILDFAQAKPFLDGQYDSIRQQTDNDASAELFDAIHQIYQTEKSRQIGMGKAIRHTLEHAQIFLNPYDIFADLIDISHTPAKFRTELYPQYKKSYPEAEAAKQCGAFIAEWDYGHTMPDWNTVLSYGITGLREKAMQKGDTDFYRSVRDAYDGILIFMSRLQRKAEESNEKNALFAAKNLKALQMRAPKTLAEAMQLYFIYYAVQQHIEGEYLRSLGALDDLLYPFYKYDLEHGRSEKEIRMLIRYFLYKWNTMRITANIPFNLCSHGANELTYLIVEEYESLNIHDPKIHIKCHAHTPDKLYHLVMQSIRNGKNSFVFINNRIAKQALTKIGITEEDAENYTLIGCYEPSAVGKEIPCTCNGRFNMAMALEAVLNNGARFADPKIFGIHEEKSRTFDTFEDLYGAVKEQLSAWIDTAMKEINAIERHYPDLIQAPILSATFSDCMEQGIDAYASGAKYNNSSISAFGIASLTDALLAIKKAVYEEKSVTLQELADILKNNWQDHAILRKKMRRYPKYGNNQAEADAVACDLLQHMANAVNRKPNGRGGVYRLGMFSIDWRIPFGAAMGASAEGRFAGEPVSKNMCASIGLDTSGITGMILSATKFDYTLVPDGTVLDLQIHPSAVSDENGIRIMTDTLKIYLKQGGFALQINVVSPETLRKAQQNPEAYKNLQIRLCGWNVYFTELDPVSQNDLIRSMERDT